MIGAPTRDSSASSPNFMLAADYIDSKSRVKKMSAEIPTIGILTIKDRASLIHNTLAKGRGLPLWDECDEDVQESWIKCVEECDEIARGITYED